MMPILDDIAAIRSGQVARYEHATLPSLKSVLEDLAQATDAALPLTPPDAVFRGTGYSFSETRLIESVTTPDLTGFTAYYVRRNGETGANGNDAAAGTITAPLLTAAAAFAKTDSKKVIYLDGGDVGWGGTDAIASTGRPHETDLVTSSLVVLPWPGATKRQLLGQCQTGLTWTLAANGRYTTTVSHTMRRVIDRLRTDSEGKPSVLTQRASTAEVEASGGWFESGGTLSVKTSDARAPDAQIVVLVDFTGMTTDAFTFYRRGLVHLHKIDFFGFRLEWSGAFNASSYLTKVEMRDVRAGYLAGSNAFSLTMTNTRPFVASLCEALYPGLDGFNTDQEPVAIFDRCHAHECGFAGLGSAGNQGFTGHNGSVCIGVGNRVTRHNGVAAFSDVAGSSRWEIAPSIAAAHATAGSSDLAVNASTLWLHRTTLDSTLVAGLSNTGGAIYTSELTSAKANTGTAPATYTQQIGGE